jgi:hypothetical protein
MGKECDPKAESGNKKTPLQLLPPVFNEKVSKALGAGASKYGAWNWRRASVKSSTYIGAIRRHLDAWMDGEDDDPESGECHLAHVAASCAVVMDARKAENLIDDRP